MTTYVDSSVLLTAVLEDRASPLDLSVLSRTVSSDLLAVECARTQDRLRLQFPEDAEDLERRARILAGHLAQVDLAPIDDDVLAAAARPLPVPLKTLDAIHLATALELRAKGAADLVMATHDAQLARAARLFGLSVIGL